MLRALVLTASLVAATNRTDPLAPYVFVAGVEGTGHHWFTSFFGHCRRPGKKVGECKSSDVGILEWQWVLAQIKNEPDAARFAVRAAAAAAAREAATGSSALRVLNTMGTGMKPHLAKEYNQNNITILCWHKVRKNKRHCGGKLILEVGEQSYQEVGEQSYPNYGGPRKAEQMPEMGFLATALEAHGQLRVVLLTRDAAAIAASVCDHRHFGGPGAAGCAKELKLLATAARVIAAQVAALPATALCDLYDLEDLTDATRGGHERLGAYLGVDAPTFAASTNAGHAPSAPPPPRPERAALVAALKDAQEGAAAACRARGAAPSEAPRS